MPQIPCMSVFRRPSNPLSPSLHSLIPLKPVAKPRQDCVLTLDQVADYEFGVALSGDLQGVTLGHNS